MALSPDQKQKLAKLSIDNEGISFVEKSLKGTPLPTIVISLGGLGGETLNILKKKFIKNIGVRPNIKFLAIDSDEGDLRHIKKSTYKEGYLDDSETIGLYDPSIAEILLRHGINKPPYINEWMRKDFPEVRIDNAGAQGTRQIGRVMLTCGMAYHNIMSKLSSMITTAETASTNILGHHPNNFEIILIAGVSGGTGSGTIIDIAYLVHRAMETANQNNYNFSAYIYTPDVQFSEVGIANSPAIMNNLKRNGYAAMKEIDYFMNLENHHGVYSINIGGGPGSQYESTRNIFSSCTIVSGILAQGMNTKMDTIQNLTENLLDLLSDIEIRSDQGNVQMASSYSSNRRANIDAWFDAVGADVKQYPKAANYVYQMLGYSAVSIPKDEILAYCINKMFQAVYREFNQIDNVDGNMVQTVLSRASICDADTLTDYALGMADDPVDMNVTLQQNEYPTKSSLRSDTDMTYAMCVQYAQFEANKVSAPTYKAKLKNEIFHTLKTQIDEIFDADGPYYVVELLTHTTDKVMDEKDRRQPFAGILEVLKGLTLELIDRANAQLALANSMNTQAQLQMYKDAAKGFMAGNAKMKAYVDFCGQIAVSSIINTALYKTLAEVTQEITEELIGVNNEIWAVYTDVLTEISKILEKDAQAVTSAQKRERTYTYDVLNLYEVSDKSQRLKKYLEDFVSPQAVDELSETFIKSMRDRRATWTNLNNEGNFDVVTEVRSIFNELMNNVLGTDIIEKFVVAAYSPQQLTPADIDRFWKNDSQEKDTALQSAAIEIFNALNTNGCLMANLDTGYLASQMLNKQMVVTLDDTPQLSKKISDMFFNAPGSYVDARSKRLSKYILSTIIWDVPLYLFDGFQEYDQVYRHTLTNIGLHMDEVKQDFRRFPQPYILDIAAKKGQDYEDFQDYSILQDIKTKADKAIDDYGFIVQGNNSYVMYNVTRQPGDTEIIKTTATQLLDVADDANDVTLRAVMDEAGYRFEDIPLTMGFNALDPLDRTGEGRYVEIGDFYKLLRMSVRYMMLLDKNTEIWEKAREQFDTALRDHQKVAEYNSNMNNFANAIIAGYVKEVSKGVWSYTIRNDNEVLVDLRAEMPFDRDYIIYHAFRNFCELRPEIRRDIQRSARNIITGLEDKSVMQDTIDEILTGDDYLGGIFAKDGIKEGVNSSELDYTFTNHPEIARNPYSVLKRFYTELKSRFR